MRQVRIGWGGLIAARTPQPRFSGCQRRVDRQRARRERERERARPSQSFRLEPENDFNWPWDCK